MIWDRDQVSSRPWDWALRLLCLHTPHPLEDPIPWIPGPGMSGHLWQGSQEELLVREKLRFVTPNPICQETE